MECVREHVDIWDKDYGVIIKECLGCVSLLTLLSDWVLYSRTEPGPLSVLCFYTLQLIADLKQVKAWIHVD